MFCLLSGVEGREGPGHLLRPNGGNDASLTLAQSSEGGELGSLRVTVRRECALHARIETLDSLLVVHLGGVLRKGLVVEHQVLEVGPLEEHKLFGPHLGRVEEVDDAGELALLLLQVAKVASSEDVGELDGHSTLDQEVAGLGEVREARDGGGVDLVHVAEADAGDTEALEEHVLNLLVEVVLGLEELLQDVVVVADVEIEM
mmetsp:Transcript_4313/g.7291  ORF Transcript_4313/g.7291 Transcript_4313/m.7291 type:complete len:202 (+) Transcript_4313:2020-2625(+)